MIIFQIDEKELTSVIESAVRAALKGRETVLNIQPQIVVNYLSRKEVAERFHISLPTLLQYTKSGKLKGHRIGRRVLYKPIEVENALNPIKSASL